MRCAGHHPIGGHLEEAHCKTFGSVVHPVVTDGDVVTVVDPPIRQGVAGQHVAAVAVWSRPTCTVPADVSLACLTGFRAAVPSARETSRSGC